MQRFGGELLSTSKLSIVKGADAFKFKCVNGHIFYKFVSDILEMKPLTSRKLSKTTAASSASTNSSSDEDMLASWQQSSDPLPGCWCLKCENFYKSAEIAAKNCGFKLVGEIYAPNLILKCIKAKHSTPLIYSKRIQSNMHCAECKKDEREAVKQKLKEEERLQDEYYRQMQEKMFAEARQEMEKELAANASSRCPQYGYYPTHQQVFLDESARQKLIEQQINEKAKNLADQFVS